MQKSFKVLGSAGVIRTVSVEKGKCVRVAKRRGSHDKVLKSRDKWLLRGSV